jgi:hypothetical protein
MTAGSGIRREQIRGFGLGTGEVVAANLADGSLTTTKFATSIYAGTPTAIDPDDAGAAGTGTTVSRGDHQHAIVTGTPASVGTANAEGAGTGFARDTHVHDIGAGAIDDATLIADGVITAAKTNHEAWTSTSPTFTNVTPGTGFTSSMHWIQIGRTVHFRAGFTLGTGGSAPGVITLTLPVNSSAGRRFLGVGAATGALGATTCGVAVITTSTLTVFSSSSWGTTNPFTWGTGHEFTVSGTYEAAS